MISTARDGRGKKQFVNIERMKKTHTHNNGKEMKEKINNI